MSSFVSQSDMSRQLEWELSLSSEMLVSHAWYHGSAGRVAAEVALTLDGQFLVRDSSSQPGDCVLSCRHNGQYLHFVINRVVIQPETVYERFQYQFEDDAYDTVADLVTSYVGSGKPISIASGARIQYPANRNYPLLCHNRTLAPAPNPPIGDVSSLNNQFVKSCCTSTYARSGIKNNITNSNPAYIYKGSNGERSNMTNVGPPVYYKSQRSMSLTQGGETPQYSRGASCDHVEETGNIEQKVLSPGWEGESWEEPQGSPPAKPARTQAAYQASGSDSGNGSGDSAQSSAPGDVPRILEVPRALTKVLKRDADPHYVEELLMNTKVLEFKQVSKFDVEAFQTTLLSGVNNKPLESDTLQTIKMFLRTSGPRILANHLTTVDLGVVLGENAAGKNNNPLEAVTGIELALLPHGCQMRKDLIERTECMKLVIAVTILTCQSDAERADVMNDWIQLAIETKTALGNLYGFAAIMVGLCMPQVSALESAWLMLRQTHTDAAFTFESKLRPCFKYMNDCSDPAPPNTTVPHLLPAIMLIHNTDEDRWWGNAMNNCEFGTTAEFGLPVVASHLETARRYPSSVPAYRRSARTVVQEMSSLGTQLDPLLLELFHTEFHIKFLWGARGADAPSWERHGRLTQILTSMSQKYPSQPA